MKIDTRKFNSEFERWFFFCAVADDDKEAQQYGATANRLMEAIRYDSSNIDMHLVINGVQIHNIGHILQRVQDKFTEMENENADLRAFRSNIQHHAGALVEALQSIPPEAECSKCRGVCSC